MIILTNALAKHDDEGGRKIAASLIAAVKRKAPAVKIFTYGSVFSAGDRHFQVNKLLLSTKLAKSLHDANDTLLYIPLYTRMLPMALRICLLSFYTRRNLRVLIAMLPETNRIGEWLIKLSGAELIVLSQKSYETLQTFLPARSHYLKAGVDAERFSPADDQKKMQLRRKYGIPENQPVVLHVGHMMSGRNLDKLLLIDEPYHVVLVTSTTTAWYKDSTLESALKQKKNITIFEDYIPHIEEIYQLSDVYFFPVVEPLNCIDVPLSALEAASCGLPVVTTPYGEMQQLLKKPGFYPIKTFDKPALDQALHQAITANAAPRTAALEYDWNRAADELLLKENAKKCNSKAGEI